MVSRELFGGGGVIGMVCYVSSEQAQGRFLDGCSDVYVLVFCMVEGVTGYLLFVADIIVDILAVRVGRDVLIFDVFGLLVLVVVSVGIVEVENCLMVREMGCLLFDVVGRMS